MPLMYTFCCKGTITLELNAFNVYFFLQRHDWYQTETHVIITVLAKNLKQDKVQIDFQSKSVSEYVFYGFIHKLRKPQILEIHVAGFCQI